MSLAKQGKNNRQAPEFNEVASVEEVKEEAVEAVESVEEGKSSGSDIDDLLSGITEKPKPPQKKQVSIYIEDDVYKAFERFGKKHGKGAKSELINNFLKKALT